MTLSEFKAWFEGFTEDMAERPTARQWKRIQERVAEITGQPVTYPVYIDRYVRPVYPYWGPYAGMLQGAGCNSLQGSANGQSLNAPSGLNAHFDSHGAMTLLGRADARALAEQAAA